MSKTANNAIVVDATDLANVVKVAVRELIRQERQKPPEPELLTLTAQDVAGLLRVSVRQVRNMDQAGTLGPKPVSLGDRLLRWDRRQVESWWAACCAAGRVIPRLEWHRLQEEEEKRLTGERSAV